MQPGLPARTDLPPGAIAAAVRDRSIDGWGARGYLLAAIGLADTGRQGHSPDHDRHSKSPRNRRHACFLVPMGHTMTCAASTVASRPATVADLGAIEALQGRAFSPGRFARTAYRVREGTPAVSPYCRVAVADERIIAALRMTAITIGGAGGALLLGPLAVEPEEAGRGHGRRLVGEALEAARGAGLSLVLLVGDMAYYGKLGFQPVPPGRIVMPGPVDPARLLAFELAPGALEAARGVVAGTM